MMTEEIQKTQMKKEFEKLCEYLDTDNWTTFDHLNHYTFFLHGWFARANESFFQEDKEIE